MITRRVDLQKSTLLCDRKVHMTGNSRIVLENPG